MFNWRQRDGVFDRPEQHGLVCQSGGGFFTGQKGEASGFLPIELEIR